MASVAWLTRSYLQGAPLLVHGEVLQVHEAGCPDGQPLWVEYSAIWKQSRQNIYIPLLFWKCGNDCLPDKPIWRGNGMKVGLLPVVHWRKKKRFFYTAFKILTISVRLPDFFQHFYGQSEGILQVGILATWIMYHLLLWCVLNHFQSHYIDTNNQSLQTDMAHFEWNGTLIIYGLSHLIPFEGQPCVHPRLPEVAVHYVTLQAEQGHGHNVTQSYSPCPSLI